MNKSQESCCSKAPLNCEPEIRGSHTEMTDFSIEPRVDARLHAAFCTNFCQPFLLSVIDWLDFPSDGT